MSFFPMNSEYNLPDLIILKSTKKCDFFLWIPDRTIIVQGRANNLHDSVFVELAHKDGIEIIKRPSGGESVILSRNTLVISVKIDIEDQLKAHSFFDKINSIIKLSLSNLGIKNLLSKGISDISIGEKKILGSSMFRKPGFLFYHAVLNVSENIEIIDKYLKHPKREPDYRKGRKHTDFVSSIKEQGYNIDNVVIRESIQMNLEKFSAEFNSGIIS